MLLLNKRFFEKNKANSYISNNNIEVKILFSSENPSFLGKTIDATAIEMSPKALRLEVPFPLEIGSVLDIALKFKDSNLCYNLTGNIRWRVPSITGHYHIGLVLRERSDIKSDYKTWKINFIQNFNNRRAC